MASKAYIFAYQALQPFPGFLISVPVLLRRNGLTLGWQGMSSGYCPAGWGKLPAALEPD